MKAVVVGAVDGGFNLKVSDEGVMAVAIVGERSCARGGSSDG